MNPELRPVVRCRNAVEMYDWLRDQIATGRFHTIGHGFVHLPTGTRIQTPTALAAFASDRVDLRGANGLPVLLPTTVCKRVMENRELHAQLRERFHAARASA